MCQFAMRREAILSCLQDCVAKGLPKSGQRSSYEFRGVDAILGCTAAGLGVTAVPRSILNDSRYPLREIGTDLPPAVSTAFWVTRRDAQNVPTVAALTRLAVEMASTDRGVAQTP